MSLLTSADSEVSLRRFNNDGFQILNEFVTVGDCDRLAAELTPLFDKQIQNSKSGIGGVRNLLRTNPLVASFAKSPAVLEQLRALTGQGMFSVRAIFFDKNPDANWLVPWHQDLAIAVAEKIETPGFTGWSVKDGTIHVHPPREILESMVTVRLHLDDCDAENGALKIISGSHQQGKMAASEISRLTTMNKPVISEIKKGGALLMRPLILHASSPAQNPSHRRVLHIEYAAQDLPDGLNWFERA